MRLTLAALTLLLLSLAPASATASRQAAPVYVLVTNGKPAPTPRRVAIRHSVTWWNKDRATHRIASDQGRWRAFALRPGEKHAVRFNRAGRYPYKVDGKAKGVVIVGAGGGGAGGLTTTFFQYDVTVRGHAQSIRTYTGETKPDRNGTETLSVDWTSTFTNVKLKKISISGAFVTGHIGGQFARGTTDATFDYKETRGDIYGPCQGTVPFSSLGTHLLLVGSHQNRSNDFTFWSQLDLEEGTRMFNEIDSQTQAACDDHLLGKSPPAWHGEDFVAQGLTFSPFTDLLELHAHRKDSVTPVWSPLKELAAGAPFTLETGLQSHSEACGTSCSAEESLQLHADVKRHR